MSRRNIPRAVLCGVLALALSILYIGGRAQLTRAGVIEKSVPWRTIQEAVGLPLSIMAEGYASHPERAPEAVRAFMSSLGDEAYWRVSYRGDFNSVKWGVSLTDRGPRIAALGWRRIFAMTLDTVRALPATSARSFLHVTAQAWAPFPETLERCIRGPITGTIRPEATGAVRPEMAWYQCLMANSPLGAAVAAPGLYLLGIILALCLAVLRTGFRACLLAVPFVTYQFGTMLLLAGNEYRFFYCTVLSGGAVILALLSQRRGEG